MKINKRSKVSLLCFSLHMLMARIKWFVFSLPCLSISVPQWDIPSFHILHTFYSLSIVQVTFVHQRQYAARAVAFQWVNKQPAALNNQINTSTCQPCTTTAIQCKLRPTTPISRTKSRTSSSGNHNLATNQLLPFSITFLCLLCFVCQAPTYG